MCGDSGIDHLEMSFASSPLLGEQLSNPAESGGSFYHSFPSPLAGRSPTLPSFRIPKYGYYSLEQESVPPDGGVSHYTIRAKSSVFNAFLQSVNFFFGV